MRGYICTIRHVDTAVLLDFLKYNTIYDYEIRVLVLHVHDLCSTVRSKYGDHEIWCTIVGAYPRKKKGRMFF